MGRSATARPPTCITPPRWLPCRGRLLPGRPRQRPNRMPCCPSHPAALSPHLGDRPCCRVDRQPVRPLVILLPSDAPASKQLCTRVHETGSHTKTASCKPVCSAKSGEPCCGKEANRRQSDAASRPKHGEANACSMMAKDKDGKMPCRADGRCPVLSKVKSKNLLWGQMRQHDRVIPHRPEVL